MIYLDYAASAPVDRRVADRMAEILADYPANPSSDHALGLAARQVIEEAREQLAACIGASPMEVIWTSGATESNNLALIGSSMFHRGRGRHLVTSKVEHKSVIDTARQLESEGWRVTWLVPQADGRITPDQVSEALQDDTVLVSLMQVNNETGAINDLAQVAAITRKNGSLLHVDAAQGLGKCPLDVGDLDADLISLSGHKVAGPKGVGALWLRSRPRARVQPLMHGGGHERGMRPGTLATHQLVGFALAAELACQDREAEQKRLSRLRAQLWGTIKSALPGVHHNGDSAHSVANIINISFDGVDGEALRADLPELALASGSACSSGGHESSYVLRALGRTDAQAHASLRMSFGPGTQAGQLEEAAAQIIASVLRLRRLSPDWADAA